MRIKISSFNLYLILFSNFAFAASNHVLTHKLASSHNLAYRYQQKNSPQLMGAKNTKKMSYVEIAAERILKNMETKLDDPKWTTYVDKLALKDYAASKGIPTLKAIEVYDNADDIDFSIFPKDFILKSNNASARNLLVKNNIIINDTGGLKNLQGKSILEPEVQNQVRIIMHKWGDVYANGKEPQYEYTVPKIYREEFITSQNVFVDLNYYISNGKATLLRLTEDKNITHNDYYYNINFEELDCPDIHYNQARFNVSDYIKHKETFDRYINLITPDIDLDFYRIDFFILPTPYRGPYLHGDGKIGQKDVVMLSEITLSPHAGKNLVNVSERLCDKTLL